MGKIIVVTPDAIDLDVIENNDMALFNRRRGDFIINNLPNPSTKLGDLLRPLQASICDFGLIIYDSGA